MIDWSIARECDPEDGTVLLPIAWYDVYPDRRHNRAARGIDDSAAERFTRAQVTDRNQDTCQLCHQRFERMDEYPYLNGSIDHIDQLGPHTMANVRLAHAYCNSLRLDGRSAELSPGQYAAALAYRVAHPGGRLNLDWREVFIPAPAPAIHAPPRRPFALRFRPHQRQQYKRAQRYYKLDQREYEDWRAWEERREAVRRWLCGHGHGSALAPPP